MRGPEYLARVHDDLGLPNVRTCVGVVDVGSQVHVGWIHHEDLRVAHSTRSWGSCSCSWATESEAPAEMTWPAVRRHLLDVRPAVGPIQKAD